MNDLQQNIIQKIKAGQVAMRPRWHFVLRSTLTVLGLLILGLVLLYVVSLIGFIVRSSGAIYAPALGSGGVVAFLLAVPWLLVVLAILFLVVLEVLVRRFSFGYQKPLLYSVLVLLLLTFFGSYVIVRSELHNGLSQSANRGETTLFGPLYRQYDQKRPKDITVGIIESLAVDELTITGRDEVRWIVSLTDNTRRQDELEIGDVVVVLGKRVDDAIEARGVRLAPEDLRPARDSGRSHPPARPGR